MDGKPGPTTPAVFFSTQWSVVLAAGQAGSNECQEALAALCGSYWSPLHAYVRRRIRDEHQAQDLTQEFFAQLLERNIVAVAQPERGRFRNFLLTALQNFLSTAATKARTQKRGGDRRFFSLDFAIADSQPTIEPVNHATPERLFERQWVITLLGLVMSRLRAECAASGKEEQFDRLKGLLGGLTPDDSIAQAAIELEMSPDAGRQAVHRLRARYRELLREEVARTVADPRLVDDEIRQLFAALE